MLAHMVDEVFVTRFGLALEAHRTGPGDFADYLICERAREAGCELVATFDRALLNQAGFSKP